MAQKLIEFQTENSHSIAWLSSNKKTPEKPTANNKTKQTTTKKQEKFCEIQEEHS